MLKFIAPAILALASLAPAAIILATAHPLAPAPTFSTPTEVVAPAAPVTDGANNQPWSGMYFNTANVEQEYEYDDAYCVTYTDPDADYYEAEICLDLQTYRAVCEAVANGEELWGELQKVDSLSRDEVDVYTLKTID